MILSCQNSNNGIKKMTTKRVNHLGTTLPAFCLLHFAAAVTSSFQRRWAVHVQWAQFWRGAHFCWSMQMPHKFSEALRCQEAVRCPAEQQQQVMVTALPCKSSRGVAWLPVWEAFPHGRCKQSRNLWLPNQQARYNLPAVTSRMAAGGSNTAPPPHRVFRLCITASFPVLDTNIPHLCSAGGWCEKYLKFHKGSTWVSASWI